MVLLAYIGVYALENPLTPADDTARFVLDVADRVVVLVFAVDLIMRTVWLV